MQRKQMPEATRWKLEDIFESDTAWEAAYRKAQAEMQKLPGFAGTLNQSPEQLKKALDAYYQCGLDCTLLLDYAHMRRDEDSTNTLYQGMSDRAVSLYTALGTNSAFLTPELLENAELEAWSKLPELALYKRHIELVLRDRPHTLSHAEEQLLARTQDLASAPSTIYEMLTLADMKFPMVHDENGQEIPLTHGRFIPLLESEKRDVRREAYDALYGTYRAQLNTIAATYSGEVKAAQLNASTRKFSSTREAAVFGNEIPVSVYDSLLSAVHRHLPAMHRYAALRKKLLQLDELRGYDLYTPITPKFELKLPFEEAYELVCDALAPLGEEYVQTLRRAREERWIDVYENDGKRSGAYMNGVYSVHPYVLLNYEPTLDNISTIAHEMGHAMHSFYSDQQPYALSNYPIFLAEVASTTNEAILLDYLGKKYPEETAQKYLLTEQLEQIRGTVYRQTMFAEFEMITHALAEKGESLTHELLCGEYDKLLRRYWGDALVIDDALRAEWARIPHFYMNFYVYQYSTGYSAAVALSRKLLSGEANAKAHYFQFLASGGSKTPLDTLRMAGVDMETPQPVDACLELFETTLAKLEALL